MIDLWRWWLCNTSDMSQIAELPRAHDKHLEVQLNSQTGGKATCWLNMLDELAPLVVPHKTALRLDRNGVPRWSGPIYDLDEDSSAGTDKLAVTALGWFNLLNGRIVHTGAEFAAMVAASSIPYAGIGTESATQLTYATQPMTLIAADLVNRANIDVPTPISVGRVDTTPNVPVVNLTLQQFQPVGQQILRLANVEDGFDVEVDPVTRIVNIYHQPVVAGSTIYGNGVDLGANVLFTYPGNCISAGRSRQGTRTANRVYATGQYGTGYASDVGSIGGNGLFEAQQALSDIPESSGINVLQAYAAAEVTAKAQPWSVLRFSPKGSSGSGEHVPQPFDDFNVGDVAYAVISRGTLQVGLSMPQAVRIFAFNVDVSDDGVEKVSGIQTNYAGATS